MEEKAEPFFIDTWRTELVITTYDQFLMSLLEPRAKYQMRFHNLCDALIIMDEVQSLPCKLWKLLSAVLRGLARTGNSQILLMSATLPPFVSETIPLLENCESYFKAFSRYELRFQTEKKRPIQDFCEDVAARLPDWLNDRERVLITLNTRKSARMVYDRLKDHWPEEHKDISSFFISADVTPKDRLKKISLIKECKPCVVVSTQCIEAGVDIDMGRVIRDFAPWDSIVQIAGRCNREGKSNQGEVFIFKFENGTPPGFFRQTSQCAEELFENFSGRFLEPDCIREYFLNYYWQNEHHMDDDGIINECQKGTTGNIQFKDIAEFKMIKTSTIPVIIALEDEAIALVKQLEFMEHGALVLRKLQQYTVQVYHYQIDALAGWLESPKPGIFVLRTHELYSDKTGLICEPPEGEAFFV